MDKRPTDTDPNAELHAFEPLRTLLAMGALVFGLVVLALH